MVHVNGAIPQAMTPALFQLGNFNVDVIPFDHPDPNVNHALAIIAKNLSMGYCIPLPDEVWEALESQISTRGSNLIVARDIPS